MITLVCEPNMLQVRWTCLHTFYLAVWFFPSISAYHFFPKGVRPRPIHQNDAYSHIINNNQNVQQKSSGLKSKEAHKEQKHHDKIATTGRQKYKIGS